MRLVVDTNTVASGLLWLGNPGRILAAAALRMIELCTTPALLDELREILIRRQFAKRIEASGLTSEELIERYIAVARVIRPAVIGRVARDPDDDAVLACALGASADLIISGDSDLLNLKHFHRIPIVPAAEAMRRIEQYTSTRGESGS